MAAHSIPIDAPILPARQRRSRRESSSSRTSACTHSPAVLSAALPARIEVPLQFRSVALAGADRIASARIAVRMCAVCACRTQVFRTLKEVGLLVVSIRRCRSLHVLKDGEFGVETVRKIVGDLRRV